MKAKSKVHQQWAPHSVKIEMPGFVSSKGESFEPIHALALFEGVGTQHIWLELSVANLEHLKEGIRSSHPVERKVVSKAKPAQPNA